MSTIRVHVGNGFRTLGGAVLIVAMLGWPILVDAALWVYVLRPTGFWETLAALGFLILLLIPLYLAAFVLIVLVVDN